MKTVIVIGSGFAGLSAATNLAAAGYTVTILEKNADFGGRARKFSAEGFTYDMGPSWYWMPDVFERYFNDLGKKVEDYYDLVRLAPSYRVFFEGGEAEDIPADMPALEAFFERHEAGSAAKLRKFLAEAAYKYEVGINDLVYRPSLALTEFLDARLASGVLRLDVFKSMASHVRGYFKHPRLRQLCEFPVIFLGAVAESTPALYSLMNYADMALGTWYPKGGMHKIVEAMVALALEKGVTMHANTEVTAFTYSGDRVTGVVTNNGTFEADIVVGAADYHHLDQVVLAPEHRTYTEKYWDSRKLAPSSLLYYVGINKKIPNLLHHNLFFDESFADHTHEIYTDPKFPTKPLVYVSAPSKTDPTVAPEGCENVFILIPVAVDLPHDETMNEHYFNYAITKLEQYTGTSIREHIVFRRDFAHREFKQEYHSYKGNAYGLANTLMQTAILKPSIKAKKLRNLYFAGQLTVPGPGVPPSLISGKVVSTLIAKEQPL